MNGHGDLRAKKDRGRPEFGTAAEMRATITRNGFQAIAGCAAAFALRPASMRRFA